MKCFFLAPVAFCGLTSAGGLFELAPPPAGTQFYTLQTKSTNATYNNQYLTLAPSSTRYTLAATASSAARFFTTQYTPTGTYALHNSDDSRQVALQGTTSVLLNLIDATNPNSTNIPGGSLMEWATFTTEGNSLGVKDGSTLANRTWVVVGSGTGTGGVALYDGVSNTTQSIVPITISLVKA